jgi:nicotinate-nucleotide--dimethylbenzimidazole phosphoribosyltransferase
MDLPQSISSIVTGIRPIDGQWIEKARARTAQLVMPTRALGRLHDMAERLCGIQQTLTPTLGRKAILIMAGDHGVVDEGVSAYPKEVTGAMIRTFLAGGAGINAIARQVQAEVVVADMGIIPVLDPDSMAGGQKLKISKIAKGTANLAKGPAMSRQEAELSVVTGFRHAADLIESGLDVLGTGDMGIGNTTPSAAIGAVLTASGLNEMVGRGTGVDDGGLLRKKSAIEMGLAVNQPDPGDGLDVLAKVGGFEIGAIAGCILAGAFYGKAVVIDGFISTAGALIAHSLCPTVTQYLFAGHCSKEPGHRIMLRHLGLDPILDLGLRLGEGTGGALAMAIMAASLGVFKEVMTFEQAGVAGKS